MPDNQVSHYRRLAEKWFSRARTAVFVGGVFTAIGVVLAAIYGGWGYVAVWVTLTFADVFFCAAAGIINTSKADYAEAVDGED